MTLSGGAAAGDRPDEEPSDGPVGGAPPPPGPIGVVLRDPLPWHEFRQVVDTAEETGYQALFVPEISGREAFSTLAGVATGTSRLRLGTGVVTLQSRNPTATAMGAATVHELSGGRMTLGIGAGSPPPASGSGQGVLARVRDYVAVVRRALSGAPVERDERFGTRGFSLSLPSPAGPPPIWLGALGDRMMALAAEVADGVILNWCTPERVRKARGIVGEAAAAAGRDAGGITVAVYVRVCLGVEESVALDALRPMTGQYASFPAYLRQLEAMGLGEEGSAAAEAYRAGRPGDVPEGLVRRLAVVGGRGDAMTRFEAYRQAGADLVLCYPVAALDPFSSVLGSVLAAAPSPGVER